MDTEKIKAQFEEYMSDRLQVEKDIISATKVSWGGNHVYLEVTEEWWRILWDVGNLYDSPGIIISIPSLSDEEYNSEDESYFDDCIEYLEVYFEEKIKEIEKWEKESN